MRRSFPFRFAIVTTSIVLSAVALAAILTGASLPAAVAAGAPVSPTAPCVDCDALYAVDCNFGLWRIDLTSFSSTLIGTTPDFMFDVALTPEGQLFAVDSSARFWELYPCTAAGILLPGGPGGNGLAASLPLPPQSANSGNSSASSAAVAVAIFGQGPPLMRTDPVPPYTTTVVGGELGSGVPFWCAPSSGDLAMHPVSGVFYSTVGMQLLRRPGGPSSPTCPGCGGDTLITLSPATGEMLDAVGCIEVAGVQVSSVFGLAFDSQGRLWGVEGANTASLLLIDPATGIADRIAVSGGFLCGEGLASIPCPAVPIRR